MNEYNFICEKQKFLGNEFDSSELSGSNYLQKISKKRKKRLRHAQSYEGDSARNKGGTGLSRKRCSSGNLEGTPCGQEIGSHCLLGP